jgi:hypothetical protein
MKKMFILLFVSLLFVSCSNTSTQTKEGIYKIYFTTKEIYNNSVGDDWQYIYKCGDTILKSGDIVEGDKLYIDITVTERDKLSDISTAQTNIIVADRENQKVYITVEENAGKYKGNTAKFEIDISIIEY